MCNSLYLLIPLPTFNNSRYSLQLCNYSKRERLKLNYTLLSSCNFTKPQYNFTSYILQSCNCFRWKSQRRHRKRILILLILSILVNLLTYFIYFIINNSFISSLCSSLTQETAFRKGITLEKCSLRHNVFYEGFRGVS